MALSGATDEGLDWETRLRLLSRLSHGLEIEEQRFEVGTLTKAQPCRGFNRSRSKCVALMLLYIFWLHMCCCTVQFTPKAAHTYIRHDLVHCRLVHMGVGMTHDLILMLRRD